MVPRTKEAVSLYRLDKSSTECWNAIFIQRCFIIGRPGKTGKVFLKKSETKHELGGDKRSTNDTLLGKTSWLLPNVPLDVAHGTKRSTK